MSHNGFILISLVLDIMMILRILFLTFFLAACTNPEERTIENVGTAEEVMAQMSWVKTMTVENLLAKNLVAEPLYLATNINGNVSIPGLPKIYCEQIVDQENFKVMPGMAEVVYNTEHAKLRVKTRAFAKEYNINLFNQSQPSRVVGR